MYLMGQLFAAFYFVLLCVHGGWPIGAGYVFESAVEVVNAFDFEILSWELGAGSRELGSGSGRRAGDDLPALSFPCRSRLAGGWSGFAFEDENGLLDDGSKLPEVVDEGDEVGVDLRVGGEVEAVGGDGALGGGDEGLDVGDDGGEAGDEGLLQRLLGLQDGFNAEGEADDGFDFAGEPFAEVRDFDADFLKDVHRVFLFLCMQNGGKRKGPPGPALDARNRHGEALQRA